MIALRDLTRADVLRAIEKFDRMGREAFLARHGFRPSHRFVLSYRRRWYDSKAIVGVAMGRGPREFSGGLATVRNRLEALGFSVVEPPWRPSGVSS